MFFDSVQSLCDKKGISISKLALDLKISKSNITNWKNGSRPRADKLEKISDYFGVSVDYLLGNEQKNKPANGELYKLSDREKEMLLAFRAQSKEVQDAALRVTGVDPDSISSVPKK